MDQHLVNKRRQVSVKNKPKRTAAGSTSASASDPALPSTLRFRVYDHAAMGAIAKVHQLYHDASVLRELQLIHLSSLFAMCLDAPPKEDDRFLRTQLTLTSTLYNELLLLPTN